MPSCPRFAFNSKCSVGEIAKCAWRYARENPWKVAIASFVIRRLMAKMKVTLKNRTVLEIDLDKLVFWETLPQIGQAVASDAVNLSDVMQLILQAAHDSRFVGIIFHYTAGADIPLYIACELRAAIAAFRAATKDAKPCVFYSLSFGYTSVGDMAAYHIAAACRDIYVPHDGFVTVAAPKGSMFFLRRLVQEKLLATVEASQRAEYKAAGEIFTRDKFSDEAKANHNTVVSSMWGVHVAAILARATVRLPTTACPADALGAFDLTPVGLPTRQGVHPLSSPAALAAAGEDGWVPPAAVTADMLEAFLDINSPLPAPLAVACGLLTATATKADVYERILPRAAGATEATAPTTTVSSAVKAAAAARAVAPLPDSKTEATGKGTVAAPSPPTGLAALRAALCPTTVTYKGTRQCLSALGGAAALHAGGAAGPACPPLPRTLCGRVTALIRGVRRPPRVAVVSLSGGIHMGDGKRWFDGFSPDPAKQSIGHRTHSALIRAVADNASVEAIIVIINSTGGCAFASAEVSRQIVRARAAGKKVVVVMRGVAASGGYYIPVSADHIIAGPMTITGSIGVVVTHFALRETFAERLGVTFDTRACATPSAAALGTQLDPLDEVAIESRERLLDAVYRTFLSHVAEHRGSRVADGTLDSIARGRVFCGADAAAVGLVDEVGGMFEALAAVRRLLGLPHDAPLDVSASPKGDLMELLSWKNESSESGPMPLRVGGALAMAAASTVGFGGVPAAVMGAVRSLAVAAFGPAAGAMMQAATADTPQMVAL